MNRKRIRRASFIGLGASLSILLIYAYLNYHAIQYSQAYQAAVFFVEKNENIHQLTGGIRDYGIPSGNKKKEVTFINMQIKGFSGDISVNLWLNLDSTGEWVVHKHEIL